MGSKRRVGREGMRKTVMDQEAPRPYPVTAKAEYQAFAMLADCLMASEQLANDLQNPGDAFKKVSFVGVASDSPKPVHNTSDDSSGGEESTVDSIGSGERELRSTPRQIIPAS